MRKDIRDRIHQALAPVEPGANIRTLKGRGEIIITDIEMPSMIPLGVVNQAEPGYLDFVSGQSSEPASIHALH